MLINLAAPQVWQPSWLICPRVSGVCRRASTKAHGTAQRGDPACYPSRKPVPSKITQNLYEYFSRKTILLYNLRKQNFEYDKCLALKNDGLPISEYFYIQFLLHDCSHFSHTWNHLHRHVSSAMPGGPAETHTGHRKCVARAGSLYKLSVEFSCTPQGTSHCW